MAVKIFAIKKKPLGTVERLVKAETLTQVKKHLASSIEIEAIGAVEVLDLMASGAVTVEDATAVIDDEAATHAPKLTNDTAATSGGASAAPDSSTVNE